MKIKWLTLIISLVVCLLAGFIGSLFTTKTIPTWYAALNKPSFNPPNWIFGPVWTLLYILMGISLYLIWIKNEETNVNFLLILFFLQLFLNSLWTFIFFGLKSPAFAFAEIILLWISILICIIIFLPVSKISSYLLIPYILWVTFAGVLNYYLWKLNQ